MTHDTLTAWATAGGLVAMGCLGYTLGVLHARWERRRRG